MTTIPGPSDKVLTSPFSSDMSDPTCTKSRELEDLGTAGCDSPHSWQKVGSGTGSEGLDQWQDTHRLASDMREAFGGIPPMSTPTGYCTFMMVGASGSGKSTLGQNLAALLASRPGPDVNPRDKDVVEIHVPEQAKATEPHDWRSAEEYGLEQLRTTVTVKNGDGRKLFEFNLQDTPGLEEADDLDKVLKIIHEGTAKHFKLDLDPAREGPLTDYPDQRFDAVLYFVGPHRLRKDDISNISRLSKLVPVIPLGAKPDSMLPRELEQLSTAVRREIAACEEKEGGTILYKFPEEVLVAAGKAHMPNAPIFAVMGSADMDPSIGGVWPVRNYAWGTVEAFSSRNSDVLALKTLLFHHGFDSLKRETEKRYHAFRKDQLQNARPAHAATETQAVAEAQPVKPEAKASAEDGGKELPVGDLEQQPKDGLEGLVNLKQDAEKLLECPRELTDGKEEAEARCRKLTRLIKKAEARCSELTALEEKAEGQRRELSDLCEDLNNVKQKIEQRCKEISPFKLPSSHREADRRKKGKADAKAKREVQDEAHGFLDSFMARLHH